MLSDSFGYGAPYETRTRHRCLEGTDVTTTPMVHKIRSRVPKRGRDLYHALILYQIFCVLSNFSKRTASQSYILIAYSVAGEHVLPTTLAACFSGFPTPISRWKYSVCEVNSPQPKPWLVLARWVSPTSRLRKGYLYNTPQKATYQYKILPLLTSKRAHAVVRATICSIRLLTHFGLKRRDHAEHSNS